MSSYIDAPVCAHPSPQVLGAQLEEALRVRCSVTANPPDVTFFWQFNNSGESLDVSPLKFGKLRYGTIVESQEVVVTSL